MFDNMGIPEMTKATEIIRNISENNCVIEISVVVTLENLEEICNIKADIVSAGCITHSAPAADFSLEFK